MSWETKDDAPYLIVGLGNPGPQYETTRHNLGYLALDVISDESGIPVDKLRFRGLFGEGRWRGQRLLLLKPTTMMNLSGESLLACASYYKVPPEKILVLYDDFDVALGHLRVRPHGGAGTHNGMRNIIKCLGTQQFPRIRIGCGPLPQGADVIRFVLSQIPKADTPVVNEALEGCCDAVELFLEEGIEMAMNRVNLRFGKNHEVSHAD